MSTANTMPQQLIEQRLDAIDQALLGLLPRQDRVAAVAQVEARIREIAAASPVTATHLDAPPRGLTIPSSAVSHMMTEPFAFPSQPQFFGPDLGGQIPSTQKKRSHLAISAAVLGILAVALLFMIPVSYFIVMTLGEVLGEVVAIGLLAAHAVALTLGGMAAIGLGLAALVSLHRRKEQLVGHGWAIAGLCAGAIPMLMGFAAVLFVGLEMGVAELFMTSQVSVACQPVSSTESESADDDGPVPAHAVPNGGSPPVGDIPMVQSVAHEMPFAATPPTAVGPGNVILTSPAAPFDSSRPDLAPRAAQPLPANSDPAPQPELPTEPGSNPESAPAISP